MSVTKVLSLALVLAASSAWAQPPIMEPPGMLDDPWDDPHHTDVKKWRPSPTEPVVAEQNERPKPVEERWRWVAKCDGAFEERSKATPPTDTRPDPVGGVIA